MDIVNQGSTYLLGLTFRDEGNNLVTPSAGRYRVDRVGGNAVTGNNANAWVAFTPSGNTHDIVITANENAFANNSANREDRIVTVEITYGANSYLQTNEYRYRLERIEEYLTTP